MLRYGPFTPYWRVALRSMACCTTVHWGVALEARSAGVVWLADRYWRSANHMKNAKIARPKSMFSENSWMITWKKFWEKISRNQCARVVKLQDRMQMSWVESCTQSQHQATPPTSRTPLTPPTAAAMDRNATCPDEWEWTVTTHSQCSQKPAHFEQVVEEDGGDVRRTVGLATEPVGDLGRQSDTAWVAVSQRQLVRTSHVRHSVLHHHDLHAASVDTSSQQWWALGTR